MNRHTPAGRGANLYLAEVEVTGVDGSMVRSLFETLGSEAVMPANVPDHILCESDNGGFSICAVAAMAGLPLR